VLNSVADVLVNARVRFATHPCIIFYVVLVFREEIKESIVILEGRQGAAGFGVAHKA
jgi:hypothetical protein